MKSEVKYKIMSCIEIEVAHHKHKLQLVDDGSHYTCNGCQELGFGDRYACSPCNYKLHKVCAAAFHDKPTITTPSITPSFYQQNDDKCIFLQQPPDQDRRSCDICAGAIHGFVYHHFDKDLDFHPTCANLELREYIAIHDGEHMTFTLSDHLSAKCFRCGKKKLSKRIKAWCYVSNCREYQIHVNCMKEMMYDAFKEYSYENGYSGGTNAEASKCQALAAVPKVHSAVDIREKRKGKGKFGMLKKIAQIALSLIMAVFVGDPTSLVATLIASIIS